MFYGCLHGIWAYIPCWGNQSNFMIRWNASLCQHIFVPPIRSSPWNFVFNNAITSVPDRCFMGVMGYKFSTIEPVLFRLQYVVTHTKLRSNTILKIFSYVIQMLWSVIKHSILLFFCMIARVSEWEMLNQSFSNLFIHYFISHDRMDIKF